MGDDLPCLEAENGTFRSLFAPPGDGLGTGQPIKGLLNLHCPQRFEIRFRCTCKPAASHLDIRSKKHPRPSLRFLAMNEADIASTKNSFFKVYSFQAKYLQFYQFNEKCEPPLLLSPGQLSAISEPCSEKKLAMPMRSGLSETIECSL